MSGNDETVRALADAGARPEARSEALRTQGWTPLHFTAVSGDAGAVTALLGAGANAEGRGQV